MSTNLRWKLVSIVVVAVLAVWAIYPPNEKVRLGLDLRGGVHLVLRVQTDDALRVETETSSEQLRQELGLRGMTVASISVVSPTQFRVEGVPQERDAEFRQLTDQQLQGTYDRVSGAGGSYTFTIRPPISISLRDESVRQALQTIERRVNELGVTEPIVAPHGVGGDQILVQLPGVTDVNRGERDHQVDGAPRAETRRGGALTVTRGAVAKPQRRRAT